jgi:hypothetical protein
VKPFPKACLGYPSGNPLGAQRYRSLSSSWRSGGINRMIEAPIISSAVYPKMLDFGLAGVTQALTIDRIALGDSLL